MSPPSPRFLYWSAVLTLAAWLTLLLLGHTLVLALWLIAELGLKAVGLPLFLKKEQR